MIGEGAIIGSKAIHYLTIIFCLFSLEDQSFIFYFVFDILYPPENREQKSLVNRRMMRNEKTSDCLSFYPGSENDLQTLEP